MAESKKEEEVGEEGKPPTPPSLKEHKALDYILSQIPKKAQKGMLIQCDLDLLCVDADTEFIILGSNVGTLFLYSRRREVVERLKTNSNNDVITSVKLHHGLEHQIVAGTSKGTIYIYQLPSAIPGQNKKLQMFVVRDMHRHKVTCCAWSLNGMKVFTGDDSGVVVSTEFDAYQGQCKSAVMLVESGSQIIQLHHSHKSLLVSTNKRSIVFRPDSDEHVVQIGQKERKVLGNFGAYFLPDMCKPKDAQLYASRPGMRIWKAGMNGKVLNTYLFKELLVQNHTEIPILFYEGVIPPGKPENQFGPLFLLEDKYLVTCNDTCLYVLNPDDNAVVGSQSKLGNIIDISVTYNEIFILRKNTNRNLIRIAFHPESKGEALYHRLIEEREKLGINKKPSEIPAPPETDMKRESHSPLHFLQTNIIEKIVGQTHKQPKPVENFINTLENLHLGVSVEEAEHEIDRTHLSHDQRDIPPVIKSEEKYGGDLPPVIKLESPDLLSVEIFSNGANSEKSADNAPLETDTQQTENTSTMEKKISLDSTHSVESACTPTYSSQTSVESSSRKSSDASSSYSGVLEERLQKIQITDEGSDDIVFNSKPKKQKKKKKISGFKSPEIYAGRKGFERSPSDNSLTLLAERGRATPDTLSITSETSDDSSISEQRVVSMDDSHTDIPRQGSKDPLVSNDKISDHIKIGENSLEQSGELIARGAGKNLLPEAVLEDINRIVKKDEENMKKEEKKKPLSLPVGRDKYDQMEKRLHEFEKSLPGAIVPQDLSKSFGKEVKVKEQDEKKTAEKKEAANETPQAVKADQLPVQRQDSTEPSIYSVYKSPAGPDKTITSDMSHTLASPDFQSPTSPSSTSTSSTDDFYKKYSSSSHSISSLTGTSDHPLNKKIEEEEEDVQADERLDSIQITGPSEEIPSPKLINNWCDIYTTANLTSLALSNNHVWYTDKTGSIQHCSILGGGMNWVKATGQAKQISVSRSGHIVWRLHNDKVYAGSRISSRNPEGMKWVDALKEVRYIAVDDTCAWYIKVNSDVMIQKNLSKDRPCFKSQKVDCPHILKQIVCRQGVVWGLTDTCRLVYRTGINRGCQEGKGWAEFESSHNADDLLFSSVTLGDGNVGWALDVVGRIWFMTDVTMETPVGDSRWWEVPVSEILVQDVTAIDTLRSLAKKFDPQKLTDLIKSQQEGLIAAGRGGVWVCPESKNTIRVCRSTVEGHLWEESLLVGIASSVAWKLISASGCHGENGLVWVTQPNGDVFTFSAASDRCNSIKRPVTKGGYISLSACRDAVWILTEEGKVYIRTGISARDPQGVDWCHLDMSQLGDAILVSLACSTSNVWAVDSDGMVYQRIGVKAPSSHSLNPAWLPVDTSNVGSTFIHIAAGPQDFMVWAIDNRKQVYTRLGITDIMPIGEKWIHIPGTPAAQLCVSENHVWALNPNGEILCRYGISQRNPGGDYWRKVPGIFNFVAASPSNELWGLSREGQIFHRHTKYLLRKQPPSANTNKSPRRKKSSPSASSDDGWELV